MKRNEQGGVSRGLLYAVIAVMGLTILVGVIYFGTASSGNAVKVEMFSPLNEVPQTTNFTVSFSREIAADSLLGRTVLEELIVFEPKIPGKFEWIARDKIRFFPEVILAPSTRYTAEISSRVAAATGLNLRGERRFEFYTPQLRVNSAVLNYDLHAESDQLADLQASIEFNYPVDPGTIEAFISILYEDGSKLPFELQTREPSAFLSLVARNAARGEDEKQLRLKIDKGLKCIGGTIGLADDYITPLNLPGRVDLRVEEILPAPYDPSGPAIRIRFNLPVSSEAAARYVTVTPDVRFKAGATHRYLDLRGNFSTQTTYQVKVAPGLRAVDGSELKREVAAAVNLQQRSIPPQVDFVGDGFYLTRSGDLNIGVSTINVDKVALEIEQVFANNLVYLLNTNDLAASGRWYDWVYNMEAMGRTLKEWDLTVANRTNEEVVTPVNVREYLHEDRVGIYRLTAREERSRWNMSAKWIVATDLGILVKRSRDQLWIWVNSLSTLQPIPEVQITLLSRNNQKLATARTDKDGVAVIKNYAALEAGLDPYLILAERGNDLSFVEITRRLIPTTDFDVAGAPFLAGGYEGYLYLERDIYRPGETAHLAAVVRGANASLPEPFPIRLRVTGPDGKLINEQRAQLNEQGAAQFDVPIRDYLMTGRYAASLLIGEEDEIGHTRFSVEEFIPDRMKVTLSPDRKSYAVKDVIKLGIDAVTLFGPPASGRAVSGEVAIEPVIFAPEKFKTFTFANSTRAFKEQKHPLAEAKLDDDGRFSYNFAVPDSLLPPSSLRGVFSATVLEPGGRGVTAYAGAQINPYPVYVGLRQGQEGYSKPHTPTQFEFIVTDPDGAAVSGRKIEVVLQRIYWQSILRNDPARGYFRYLSEEVVEEVDRFMVESGATIGSFSVTPQQYGKYRVLATDVAGSGSASLDFYSSGWGYAPWAMDNPDRIEIDFDKESYDPGDVAVVQVRAPFGGKLLLTVERERVFSHQIMTLKENTATIKLPIGREWKPNVFVSAHLIRSTGELERDTPLRAFGVAPLTVKTESERLAVKLQVPTEIRPNTELSVEYTISDPGGAPAYLTIAAVDEGICQLTDFKAPDPHAFFYGKKRLSVETYDLYSAVLPEILLKKTPAGDIEAARRRQLTPTSMTRVKPVAFWSGLVKTDRNGSGKVSFKIPQFNGQLRIMAAAFAGPRFGNAQKNLFVREPLVLTPTFPRFIGSMDDFVIPVGVYNGSGTDGSFVVRLSAIGPVSLTEGSEKSVAIAAGREAAVYFRVKAGEGMGTVKFTLSASGNGVNSSMTEEVPLRPPVPFVTVGGQGSLTEKQPARFEFPSEFIPGTTDFTLSVSSFPSVRFVGSLQYLLGYPHGCLEQTVSKLFPMLYFDELAQRAEPELFGKSSVDYFVEEGIAKLVNMQLPSGAFMYWPQGSYQNNWSSVYAAHFLIEARKAGYSIPDRVYDRAIGALQTFARNYPSRYSPESREDSEGEGYYRSQQQASYATAAYAVYVLAHAGKPDRSTMNFLRGVVLDRLPQYSQYQLAGAFALIGDPATARSLMPAVMAPRDSTDRWESGGNFHSPVRAQAIMLEVLAEVEPESPLIPKLVESLTKAANESACWETTQDNAFALLAMGKVFENRVEATYTGSVTIDGKMVGALTTDQHDFSAKDWLGKTVEIAIQGAGTAYYYWRADGLPTALRVPEFDNDLQVRRRYLDENGNALDYDEFRQGDLIIAEISIKALTEEVQNVAVVDLLPSGFEIENARLQSRQAIKWIGEKVYQPRYVDIRDDRLIIYGDFRLQQESKFYYGIRVVTEGTFALPPVRGEAMYAPRIASVGSSGRVSVQRP